ncbi:MAG: hypothetical protein ACD_45C00423G0001 [uncultured bacterium]|nr:MAG: hypothetical protein ACD_45C00423G0001 [uncultured bacterium]
MEPDYILFILQNANNHKFQANGCYMGIVSPYHYWWKIVVKSVALWKFVVYLYLSHKKSG